ncbi:MAG TPA: alginate export family protein [Terriglobia bacterium]|nr:alginate export family protein [Terriglobia bacterium]
MKAILTTLCLLALTILSPAAFAWQQAPQPTPAVAPATPAAQPAQPLLTHVNRELPAWLRFSGEYRMRLEGVDGAGFRPDSKDAYVLSRVRINMRVSPTYWMRFMFQGQDAQSFWRNQKPDAPPFEDTMDIRQAYVEFGKAEAPMVLLRVGRQELFFGEQRLIGHLNWTNTARSFDAARMTVQKGNYKVDLFAASVVNAREGTANKSSGGNDIHGAYGSITKLVPNATIEPYAFWRLARGTRTETGLPGKTDRRVYGGRFAGKLPANFDYSIEAVGQTGSVGTDTIRASASHATLGYTVASLKKKPRVVLEYNYASGDETPGDGRQQTFDQLYPTGHDKLGLSDQVGWKNIHDLRAGVEFKPTAKLTSALFYHSWWLASPKDALYNAAGAPIVRVAAGTAGRHVGQEASIQMTYAVNATTSIGAGYANIFPGTFLKNATPGKQYRLPYLMLTHSF